MMHGGVVVPEPDDVTIVLSQSTGSSSTECPRYSIDWLHESIKENNFLDIIKYILPVGRPANDTNGSLHNTPHKVSKVVSRRDLSPSIADSDVKPKQKVQKISPNASCSKTSWNTGRLNYSEDENQAMIDFLIENNAISSGGSRAMWNKAKAKGMFPDRSAVSLQSHYYDTLRYNFRKYTNDPRAVEKFEKLEHRQMQRTGLSRNTGFYYTEEERRKMINYLITNKAIPSAFSIITWKKMEADKILVKPSRSAGALCKQFYKYLQYHYMNYTKDPRALNEFEEVVKAKKGASF